MHILTPRDPLPLDVPVPVLVPRCADYRHAGHQAEREPVAAEQSLVPRRPPISRALTVPSVQLAPPQQGGTWLANGNANEMNMHRSHSLAELGSIWHSQLTYAGFNGGNGGSGAENERERAAEGGFANHIRSRALQRSISQAALQDGRESFDHIEEEEGDEQRGVFRLNDQGIWYMDRNSRT